MIDAYRLSHSSNSSRRGSGPWRRGVAKAAAIAAGSVLVLGTSQARADSPPTSAYVERLVGTIVSGIGAGLVIVGTTTTPWLDYVNNINGGPNVQMPPQALACIIAGAGAQIVGIPLWIVGQYRISEARSRQSFKLGAASVVPMPRGAGLRLTF